MASTSARSVLVLAKHRLPARTHSLASRRLLSVTPATSSPAPLAESHKSKAPSPAPVAPATSATPKANAGTTKPALDAHKESWFTGALRSSPLAMGIFLRAVRVLGYGTPQQIAARRTLALYEVLCSGRVEEEAKFWTEQCSLPPTFQSWFTVTNIHVWLLTVRLRSLPKPTGQHYIQSLIDHFFFDVEDRIRLVLRAAPTLGSAMPLAVPTSSPSSPTRILSDGAKMLKPYYIPPGPHLGKDGKPSRLTAPERLVTRQMKVLKEQWSGVGLALDLGLARSDADLAAAVWRNLMGGRGASGIAYPWEGMTKEEDEKYFRRSVNPVGGSETEVRRVDLKGLEKEEKTDDFSGVRDYRPSEADKYVDYPETMLKLVEYIRREAHRLEQMSDEEITGPQRDERGMPFPQLKMESVERLRFGKIQ